MGRRRTGHRAAARRTVRWRRAQLGGRDGEVIELDIGSADQLARDITGYGADAVVLEPQSLREDVLAGCAPTR